MKNVISTWALFLKVLEIWAYEVKLDFKKFVLERSFVFG
jgi:hypothetical protein